MICVDMSGLKTEKPGVLTNRDSISPGIDELTGMDRSVERAGAIIALHVGHKWSTGRLASLFDMSARRVQQIIREFKQEFPEVCS